MTFEVIQASPALGAEIRGLDLSQPLDEVTRADLRKTWLDRHVLLFRGQSLSDEELVRFSAYFGKPDLAPPNEARNTTSDGYVPDLPEITVISNVVENGIEIGSLGAGECAWHTDMTYVDDPPSACLLHALELPESGGGGTGFLNLCAAYDAMPETLKAAIDGKQAIHAATHTSAGNLRKGYEDVTDVSKTPGARHPLVVKHPESGRCALMLGRRQNSYILGLPVAESETLLDKIWEHAVQPQFIWHHDWQLGDVVMWDNRCTMHVRHEFDPSDRRIMHRTQVRSDGPYYLGA